MNEPFEATLIAALDDLEEGDSIETILQRYSEHAAELGPALAMVAHLETLPPAHTAEAELGSRHRFLEQAAALKADDGPSYATPLRRRLFFSFGSAAVVFALLALILVPASQNALPGDILYGVKRSYEDARLFFATGDSERQLQEQIDEERNREVYEMVDTGRDGFAGYKGILTEMAPGEWTIGRLPVIVGEETVIAGEPEVGARVAAHCRVEDGLVYAERIEVLDPVQESDGANRGQAPVVSGAPPRGAPLLAGFPAAALVATTALASDSGSRKRKPNPRGTGLDHGDEGERYAPVIDETVC